MPGFKDLEYRLRAKYQFPDDETTRGTPSETIYIGKLFAALKTAKYSTSVAILDKDFRNPRLKNLAALLWRACEMESSQGFGRVESKAITAIATGIYSGIKFYKNAKKADILLESITKILPKISDQELATIQIRNKKFKQDMILFDKEVRRELEKYGTVLECDRPKEMAVKRSKCRA